MICVLILMLMYIWVFYESSQVGVFFKGSPFNYTHVAANVCCVESFEGQSEALLAFDTTEMHSLSGKAELVIFFLLTTKIYIKLIYQTDYD